MDDSIAALACLPFLVSPVLVLIAMVWEKCQRRCPCA
jgi:hypothetical protein